MFLKSNFMFLLFLFVFLKNNFVFLLFLFMFLKMPFPVPEMLENLLQFYPADA